MGAVPLFNVGDTVCVKESAQIGIVDEVTISSATMVTNSGWTYTISYGPKLPSATTFGDKITYRQPRTLYFTESELLTFCDAIDVAEDNLLGRLHKIQLLRSTRC